MQSPSLSDIHAALSAIARDERIRDVLISGGDALSLPNEVLAEILMALRAISHIDVIRLCTRMPCTLPQRMNDPVLLGILRRAAPIYLNTHFNHGLEASVESEQAFALLRESGCILGNQTVLLRGINDDFVTLERLNRWLLRQGCRPYYLFQCDVAQGTQHFRTPLCRGMEIMRHLRGNLSGLGIPNFVLDLPGGLGKVELCPSATIEGIPGEQLWFRSWSGAVVGYDDITDGEGERVG
jgi:lysine 2,3-aminomutase